MALNITSKQTTIKLGPHKDEEMYVMKVEEVGGRKESQGGSLQHRGCREKIKQLNDIEDAEKYVSHFHLLQTSK